MHPSSLALHARTVCADATLDTFPQTSRSISLFAETAVIEISQTETSTSQRALRSLLLARGWREVTADRYESDEYRIEWWVESDGQLVIVARAVGHTITFTPSAFVRWLLTRGPASSAELSFPTAAPHA